MYVLFLQQRKAPVEAGKILRDFPLLRAPQAIAALLRTRACADVGLRRFTWEGGDWRRSATARTSDGVTPYACESPD